MLEIRRNDGAGTLSMGDGSDMNLTSHKDEPLVEKRDLSRKGLSTNLGMGF
jgi:hypothetical protein